MKYQLYYGDIRDLPDNVRYSFYDPYTKRALIFSETRRKGFKAFKDESALTANERSWLFSVKNTVNAKHMNDNKGIFQPFINNFLDLLESELEKECGDKNM